MRRIAFLLAGLMLLLALPGALAESGKPDYAGLDLTQASLDELKDLYERIALEIESRDTAEAPFFPSGTYAAGLDMPAGIYLVREDEHGIFPSMTVRRGSMPDSPLESYEIIIKQAVVQISTGTFVTLTDAVAYPFESVTEDWLAGGEAGEGGYWVGPQIPEGTYRIVADEKAPLSSYSVYSGILGTNPQLERFETVNDEIETALVSGQYIVLSGCSIALPLEDGE